MKVDIYGQVFTPEKIVDQMLNLIKNNGSVLEPSCGNGAFYNKLKNDYDNVIGIEIDRDHCPKGCLNMDFFDYGIDNKFDTIIGNPPYVKNKDILTSTKEKLDLYKDIFNNHTNLFQYFIYKSVLHLNDGGELIFLVPTSFFKASSSYKMNEFLYRNGTITDVILLGDKAFGKEASPDTIIFRYEKGNFNRKNSKGQYFYYNDGILFFLKEEYPIRFKDIFFVKTGAASGADEIFNSENGNLEMVCSYTKRTGKLRRVFYDTISSKLLKNKDALLERKIVKITEDNWYKWGRSYYESDKERLYVNYISRHKNPFFYNECKAYDGSILAIFPIHDLSKEEILNLKDDLNSVDWEDLGFVSGGRKKFTQSSLEKALLPDKFRKYLKPKKSTNSSK